MTATLFITLFAMGAAVCGLFTQAVKGAFEDWGVTYSANTIALVNAAVIGIFGTICAYTLLGIPFNVPNIVCIIFMTVCIWLGSMVGYDKIKQLITQIVELKQLDSE